MKSMCIGWILGELFDLDLWPHPWPWPLIFQGQISKQLYLRNCYLIGVKQKESKSVRYWAGCMVMPFHHTNDLDLVVSRSEFEIALFEEWEGWLTWTERDVSGSFMIMTVTSEQPWWGGWMDPIVTGVTSDVGVPSMYLVLQEILESEYINCHSRKGIWKCREYYLHHLTAEKSSQYIFMLLEIYWTWPEWSHPLQGIAIPWAIKGHHCWGLPTDA